MSEAGVTAPCRPLPPGLRFGAASIIAFLILLGILSPNFCFGTLTVRADEEPSSSDLVEIVSIGNESPFSGVLLRIPQEFRFRSSIGQRKTTGINIVTFYPSFTSLADSANRAFAADCIGYCNGRFMLAIKNMPPPRAAAWLKTFYSEGAYGSLKDHKPTTALRQVRDFTPRFGFDHEFEEISGSEASPWTTRYFLKDESGSSGLSALAVDCMMSVPHPACKLHFFLTCAPAVEINIVGWSYDHIREAFALQRRAGQFVSSMLVQPKCS